MISVEKEISLLFSQFEKLVQYKETQIKKLSDVDNELSRIYHIIEGIDITHVSQSHKLFKELKAILIERRLIKKEASLIQSTIDNLETSMIKTKVKISDVITKHEALISNIHTNANIK